MGRRGVGGGGCLGEKRIQIAAGHDDPWPRVGQQCHRRLDHRQYRSGREDDARPAVGEHERKFWRTQLGVDRDRHDPGGDRAEESGRKIDPVV